MFRLFTILVRTTYLLTALIVLACTLPSLLQFVQALFRPAPFERNAIYDLYIGALLVILFLLALRALVRLFRRAQLIPDSHLRERPIVASLVVITCLLGCALFLLVAWARLVTLPNVGNGNFAGPLMLAFMLFAVALLTGELVLVGRMRPPAAAG